MSSRAQALSYNSNTRIPAIHMHVFRCWYYRKPGIPVIHMLILYVALTAQVHPDVFT